MGSVHVDNTPFIILKAFAVLSFLCWKFVLEEKIFVALRRHGRRGVNWAAQHQKNSGCGTARKNMDGPCWVREPWAKARHNPGTWSCRAGQGACTETDIYVKKY